MTPANTSATGLQAKDVMTKHPVTVSASDTVREVARIFDSNEISGAPVIDGSGRVIGVVSKTDLLHRYLEGPEGSRRRTFYEAVAEGLERSARVDPDELGVVEDFMSPDPITVAPETDLATVARKMAEHRVHRVIVVSDGLEPVGVVTSLDVLKCFAR